MQSKSYGFFESGLRSKVGAALTELPYFGCQKVIRKKVACKRLYFVTLTSRSFLDRLPFLRVNLNHLKGFPTGISNVRFARQVPSCE